MIAELPFGFWRYLSSAAHEVPLWRPYSPKLGTAAGPSFGTDIASTPLNWPYTGGLRRVGSNLNTFRSGIDRGGTVTTTLRQRIGALPARDWVGLCIAFLVSVVFMVLTLTALLFVVYAVLFYGFFFGILGL